MDRDGPHAMARAVAKWLLGTLPLPLMEILNAWTTQRLETWVETTSRCLRRGAQLTNSWGIEFMFAGLCAYIEDVHIISRASLVRRTRMNSAIGNAMMSLATQDENDLATARRSLDFESP